MNQPVNLIARLVQAFIHGPVADGEGKQINVAGVKFDVKLVSEQATCGFQVQFACGQLFKPHVVRDKFLPIGQQQPTL